MYILLGGVHELGDTRFWDMIVLTASDEHQKISYKMLIEKKLSQKALPSGVHYEIFADPPGERRGEGTTG